MARTSPPVPPTRPWPIAPATGHGLLAGLAAWGLGLGLGLGLAAPGLGTGGGPGLAPAQAADRGLFIAVDDYAFDALDLPPDSSTRDARSLARLAETHLGFPKDSIKLLENDAASRAGILAAIDEWLIAGTAPGDRVILTYSGHGTHVPDTDGDEEDGEDEALVPWDARPGPKGHPPMNLLYDDTIKERLTQLAGRDVLILVDSCHSGTVTRAFAAPGEKLISRDAPALRGFGAMATGAAGTGSGAATPPAQQGPDSVVPETATASVRVFTAAAADEVAYVNPHISPPQGVFTHAIMQAIENKAADANGNGIVSNAEVLAYLRKESGAFCDSSTQCPSLTPTLETSEALIARDFSTGRLANAMPEVATDGLAEPATPLGVTLALEPSSHVRLGQEVVFRISATQDGYLVVFDINAAGEVVQLYPNTFSEAAGRGNRIVAGQPVGIPDPSYGFVFHAQEPVGNGMVLAIVTSQPTDLAPVIGEHLDLSAIARPEIYIGSIAARLASHSGFAGGPGDHAWGLAVLPYSINP